MKIVQEDSDDVMTKVYNVTACREPFSGKMCAVFCILLICQAKPLPKIYRNNTQIPILEKEVFRENKY